MTKLTEEIIVSRSKQSDLASIKKLNCWGSDLTDISIIRRMRGVEVLALSVNQISTLADFEGCERLQELYLRKNNIQDISELAYLQNLPSLRNLWLEENPCVERAGPHYRMIVLRALPHLTKLDNTDVTPEEVNEALRGTMRRDEPAYEEQYQEPPPQQTAPSHTVRQEYRQTSPMRESSNVNLNNTEETVNSEQSDRITDLASSPVQRSPTLPIVEPVFTAPCQLQRQRQSTTNGFSDDRMRSPGSDQDGMYSNCGSSTSNNNCNNNNGAFRERGVLASSTSTQSMKEYYQSEYQRTPNGQYRHSQTDLSEWDEQTENATPAGARGYAGGRRSRGPNDRDVPASYGRGGPQPRDDWEEERLDRTRRISSAHQEHRRSEARGYSDTNAAVLSHYANIHRRPMTRNANLLSAALCLIKELDHSSLEVVEHAVRCRIEELHAHAE